MDVNHYVAQAEASNLCFRSYMQRRTLEVLPISIFHDASQPPHGGYNIPNGLSLLVHGLFSHFAINTSLLTH